MEDNLDSIKENINNVDDPLKNESGRDNDEENQSKKILNNSEEVNPSSNKNSSNGVKTKIETDKDLNITPNADLSLKKKEIPIEKKPFNEFVNDHLIPSLIQEFKLRGFEVEEINLQNTFRPIAGDKCWVIFCGIKEICNFWLSFEKEDISSLKSISICSSGQKPSIIESFLIDEKRITLKLIISRILQRLNGQKLIGIN